MLRIKNIFDCTVCNETLKCKLLQAKHSLSCDVKADQTVTQWEPLWKKATSQYTLRNPKPIWSLVFFRFRNDVVHQIVTSRYTCERFCFKGQALVQVTPFSFIVGSALKDNTVLQNQQHPPHLSQQRTIMDYSLRSLSHRSICSQLASVSDFTSVLLLRICLWTLCFRVCLGSRDCRTQTWSITVCQSQQWQSRRQQTN